LYTEYCVYKTLHQDDVLRS